MFELSPRTYAVIETRGRLIRKFPGAALSIPIATAERPFLKTLARILERMSGQVVPETLPSTKKAGQTHDETRDTACPKMVTELLMAFMLSLGQAVEVTSIEKHTRDDVLWKSCLLPWRRSPMLLLIKVSIQLMFLRSGLEPQEAQRLYKYFMVHFASYLLSKITPVLKSDASCIEWCDITYIMRAKVSRRLLKLDKPLPQAIQQMVREAMGDNVLQKTWNDIQMSEAETSRIDTAALRSLDFEKDTLATLPSLDAFISSISQRHSETMARDFTPVCPLPETKTFEGWTFWNPGYSTFQTAWWDTLMPNISQWLDREQVNQELGTDVSCATLWRVMKQYEDGIRNTVRDNPEAWSLQILVELELWVALDKIACMECPMLLDYDSDVNIERLECLLLPAQSHMKRLNAVEKYITERKARGTKKGIWTSFGNPDTFAVRYFDQSHEHQSLRHSIEDEAKKDRKRKEEEFSSLKAKYKGLLEEYNTSECDVDRSLKNGKWYSRHPKWCRRCQKKTKADNMRIAIHEWPLPTNKLALKTVVFELKVPEWFTTWRQATSFVRFNVLQYSYSSAGQSVESGPNFPLKNCPHLSTYFDTSRSARMGLLSIEKSHVQTHYKTKSISSLDNVREVLFDNGRQYKYYDFVSGCFVGDLSATEGMDSLARSTTYKLPSTCSSMQKFIHRPWSSPNGPSPNTVLATQSECPSHLTLTEYKALCAIPLGHGIQWQNVLLQVTSPAVDFKKPETVMVVLQAMYQAGPCKGGWHRDGHRIPATSERFSERMLGRLRIATEKIVDNWKSVNELACYIAIARRILSLGVSDELKQDALAYLSRARDVGLRWVETLKDRVESAVDEEKQHFRSKVAHAALVCADSFNFEDTLSTGKSILGFALQSPDHMANFIESCITIQEYYAPDSKDTLWTILYWSWQQLCVRANAILFDAIVNRSSDALDAVIKRSFCDFNRIGEGWTAASMSECHHDGTWLTTESASTGGKSLTVHYCLVTGELLVNGLPLSRLPVEYERHTMYATLFGSAVLEVAPSNMPGMVFSGRKLYAGHNVFLGLSVGGDLHVKARKNSREWEIVHPARLKGLPRRLVSGCVHWYDINSKTVEFRPKNNAWTTSDAN